MQFNRVKTAEKTHESFSGIQSYFKGENNAALQSMEIWILTLRISFLVTPGILLSLCLLFFSVQNRKTMLFVRKKWINKCEANCLLALTSSSQVPEFFLALDNLWRSSFVCNWAAWDLCPGHNTTKIGQFLHQCEKIHFKSFLWKTRVTLRNSFVLKQTEVLGIDIYTLLYLK